MFWTTPSIDIKIMIDVEPADMNGSGKAVDGTGPDNTSYYIIKFFIGRISFLFYIFNVYWYNTWNYLLIKILLI